MQFRVGTADSSGFLGISASRIFMYGAHILVGEGSVRKERAPEALFSVCPIFATLYRRTVGCCAGSSL